MNPMLIIATNTWRENIRQRLFHNIIIFGVGMMIFAMVVSNITFGFPDRVVRSIGLSGVSVALNLMALLIGVSLVHREIDNKTLFVVLTRPVERWQYVIGRYLGLVGNLAVVFIGFSAIFFLMLGYVLGTPNSQDMVALFSSFLEACILGAFATLLSSFSTPSLSAGIGLGFWIACASADDLVGLSAKADASTKVLMQAISWVLPNFAAFNFREAAIYIDPVSVGDVAFTLVYAGLYMVGFIALASAVLSRREMV